MDLYKSIFENLILFVDFDGKYKKEGKDIKQEVRYFLVGVLPVILLYENGEKERAKLNIPVEIEQDPYVRVFHQKRVKEVFKFLPVLYKKFKFKNSKKYYQDKIINITETGLETVQKSIDSGEWNGKKIKSILIVKISDFYDKAKNNK